MNKKKNISPVEKRVPEPIVLVLQQTTRRLRRLLLTRGLLAVLAFLFGSLLVVMAIDAGFTLFSGWIRWTLSLTALAVTLIAAWRYLVRPLRLGTTLYQMARRIERCHPELEERLSSTIELLGEEDDRRLGGSEAMIRRLAMEATDRVGLIVPRREISLRSLRKVVIAVGVLIAILLVAAAVWPLRTVRLLGRAVAPFAEIGNATAMGLRVEPGDITCVRGAPLEIRVAGLEPGTRRAQLRRRSPENPETGARMIPVDDGSTGEAFGFKLPAVSRSFRYRIFAGGALTRYFEVNVVEAPAVNRALVHYDYPDYTGQASETIELPVDRVAQLDALVGTEARLTVVPNKPVKQATMQGIEGRPEPGVTSNAWSWTMTLSTNLSGPASIELTDALGFSDRSFQVMLKPSPDGRPTVERIRPLTDQVRIRPDDRLPLGYVAKDDYGIAGAALVLQRDGHEPVALSIDRPPFRPDEQRWSGRSVLDLQELELSGVRSLAVRVRVRDGVPPELGGPREALTKPVILQLDHRARSYIDELLGRMEGGVLARLTRARDELKRALGQAHPLPGLVVAEGKLSHDALNRINAAYEHTWQAHLQVTDAAEWMRQSLYEPMAGPAVAIRDTHIEPPRRKFEVVRITDDHEERGRQVRVALVELRAGVSALEDFMKRVRAHSAELKDLLEIEKIAQRAHTLARKAREADPDAETDPDWRNRQRRLADQLAEIARRHPGLLAELIEQQLQEVGALIVRTRELAEIQKILLPTGEALAGLPPETTREAAVEQLDDSAGKRLNESVEQGRRRLKAPVLPADAGLPGLADTQKRLADAAIDLNGAAIAFELKTGHQRFPPHIQDAMRRAVNHIRLAAPRAREAGHDLDPDGVERPGDRAARPPLRTPLFEHVVANQKQAHTNLVLGVNELVRFLEFLSLHQAAVRAHGAEIRAKEAVETAKAAAEFAREASRQVETRKEQAEEAAKKSEQASAQALAQQKTTQEAARKTHEAVGKRKREEASKQIEQTEKAARTAEEKAREAMDAARDVVKELARESAEKSENEEPKPPLHFKATPGGGGSGTGSGDQGTGAAIAGSAPGQKMKKKPPPPMPRALSEAMDRAVTAESLPRSADAAEAEEGFAQMLDQMAGQMAADSGLSAETMSDMMAAGPMEAMPPDMSAAAEEAAQSSPPSPQPGAGKGGGGASGGGSYALLRDTLRQMGLSSEDWLRLPGSLRKDILSAAEARDLPEYRTLIQGYFREIARRGTGKEVK